MKKFRMQDMKGNTVLADELDANNVYISAYGKVVSGKNPNDLEVDESCTKEYALSGQKPTRYIIVRVS